MTLDASDGQRQVIVIGAARSGTKFARDILAASTEVAKVPYDVNYVWRLYNENVSHDELDPASATPKVISAIHAQLNRLAKPKSQASKLIIEKSVSNSLRVPFVNRVFPNAKYIHLVRDGRAVTESAMRLWTAKPDLKALTEKLRAMSPSNYRYVLWFGSNFAKGLLSGRIGGRVWGPRYKGILDDVDHLSLAEVCAKQWQRSVELSLQDLSEIPSGRVFTLSYSQLVSDRDIVRDLAEFSGISDIETVLQHHRDSVRPGNDDKWRDQLHPQTIDRINQLLQPTLDRLSALSLLD